MAGCVAVKRDESSVGPVEVVGQFEPVTVSFGVFVLVTLVHLRHCGTRDPDLDLFAPLGASAIPGSNRGYPGLIRIGKGRNPG